jgi:feruloyl esterase
VAAGAALLSATAAAAQERNCADLAQPGAFANTVVSSARAVPADAEHAIPAHCEVIGAVASEPGSRIGVVIRLPASWNGKFVGFGGGGWAGNVRLETAAAALGQGYATAQTDGGHPSANPGDTSWVAPGGRPDEVALRDFAYRGIHETTVLGKAMVARYYGRPQQRAYFQGCSTGGRMALMEAQRFPDDYDGVTAGAPVYTLRVQSAEIWRDLIFAQPGAALTKADAEMIHKASLAACDELDGLKDGIVANPAVCRFDPATLACRDAATTQCLTPQQLAAVRKAYAELRSGADVVVFPLGRGSEDAWGQFTNIGAVSGPPARNLGLRPVMFGDPGFDFASFDPARDVPKVRALPFAKYYEAADPDLSAFIRRGGKLILWHGVDDPGPSYLGTVEYFQNVQKTTGPKVGAEKLDASVRLFLAPGVYHCGGGPGPDRFDLLTALDRWVEAGAAPTRIAANKADGTMPRPLCPYPALPRYQGRGDVRDERSFVCRR